jgi:isopentenyldiphosphate isomerase
MGRKVGLNGVAEEIDIFDANLTRIGSMDFVDAHRQALWHRAFHCWVVNGDGSVLIQQRSSAIATYEGCLDVSAAGHLRAGETVADGIREVQEELGIEVERGQLFDLGYRTEAADLPNDRRNREYQFIALLRCDLPLSAYRPQADELDGLYWLPIAEGLKLFSGAIEESRGRGVRYDGAAWVEAERTVRREDFVPRVPNYYLTVCIMAERLLEGRFPLAIS